MQYLYTFGFPSEEQSFCRLEQRMFFGKDCGDDINFLVSDVAVPPSRSPFIKTRVSLLAVTNSLEEIIAFASTYSVGEKTFKVVSLNDKPIGSEAKITLRKRREMELAIANVIVSEPDLEDPDVELAIVKVGDTYYFGEVIYGESVWQKHIERPVPYSTALSAKHARALVNITAPVLDGVRIVDPCCGVGTVVIEALSMGANILGRDMNWFVTTGSRKNIAHFGYEGVIELGPIEDITDTFDAVIIDMPYNLFTNCTDDNKQSIITNARRISNRVVFVSSEDIRTDIEVEQFKIVDECTIKKQQFIRNVYVCNA